MAVVREVLHAGTTRGVTLLAGPAPPPHTPGSPRPGRPQGRGDRMDEWITASSLKTTKNASIFSGAGAGVAALAAVVVPLLDDNLPTSVLVTIVVTAGVLAAVSVLSGAVDAAARAYVAGHRTPEEGAPRRTASRDGERAPRGVTREPGTVVPLPRPLPVAVHQATGYLASCVELGPDNEPARYLVARAGRPPAWVPAGGVSTSPDLVIPDVLDLREPGGAHGRTAADGRTTADADARTTADADARVPVQGGQPDPEQVPDPA